MPIPIARHLELHQYSQALCLLKGLLTKTCKGYQRDENSLKNWTKRDECMIKYLFEGIQVNPQFLAQQADRDSDQAIDTHPPVCCTSSSDSNFFSYALVGLNLFNGYGIF